MRILVKGPNHATDLLLCLPALHALRRTLPKEDGYHIDLLIPRSLWDLLHRQDCCDRLLKDPVDSGKRGLALAAKYAAMLRSRRKYDAGLCFTRQFSILLGFYLAKVPKRFGYAQRDLKRLLTRSVAYSGPSGPYYRHTQSVGVAELAECVAEELAARKLVQTTQIRLKANPVYEKEINATLDERHIRDFYCIVPGSCHSSEPMRAWPLGRYIRIAEQLFREREQYTPVWLFTPDDAGLYRAFCRRCPIELIQNSLVIKPNSLNFGKLMAILGKAKFAVTNDVSARHIATGLETKVISVFGPTDLNRAVYSADLEQPVHVDVGCNRSFCPARTCQHKQICMQIVTADLVLNTIRRFVFSPEGATVI